LSPIGAILTVLVAGCAARVTPATPTQPPVFAGESSAVDGPATASSSVPQPIPLPTVTSLFRPTPASSCINGASFIEDLTVPDGTVFLPREAIDKRWSIRNSGTCDWGPDYRLVQVGSSDIQGPVDLALFPAQAGSTAVWQVALVAPAFPGEYLGRWQARAPDGALFGDEVFVLIFVEEPEPTATPTVSPPP